VSSSPPNPALGPLTHSINPVTLADSAAMLGAEQPADTQPAAEEETLCSVASSPRHRRLRGAAGLTASRQPTRECAGLALEGELCLRLRSLRGSPLPRTLCWLFKSLALLSVLMPAGWPCGPHSAPGERTWSSRAKHLSLTQAQQFWKGAVCSAVHCLQSSFLS